MTLIESEPLKDWHDLQERAACILRECGMVAETDQEVALARGIVRVDVLARDPDATPPTTIICECKHWSSPVSKEVVHAFRTVVTDAGAHLGLLISTAGFQSGAEAAADHSNVRLVTWEQFQEMFSERWFRRYYVAVARDELDPLHEYTEPINSRIAREAAALGPEKYERFRELRDQYGFASFHLLLMVFNPFAEPLPVPALPLRASVARGATELPAEILDATALRELLERVAAFYRKTAEEFDAVFGRRV